MSTYALQLMSTLFTALSLLSRVPSPCEGGRKGSERGRERGKEEEREGGCEEEEGGRERIMGEGRTHTVIWLHTYHTHTHTQHAHTHTHTHTVY